MCKLLILFTIAFSLNSTFHQKNFPFVQSLSVISNEVANELPVIRPLGEIAYEIDTSFTAIQRCTVQSVLYNIMFNSCIRFRPKGAYDQTYLSITQNLTCGSVYLGHGGQTVREDGLLYTFVCHTILNASDLWSNNFSLETVKLIPQNTKVEYVPLYNVGVDKSHNLFLEKFDFDSIMHDILKMLGENATLNSINQLYHCPNRMKTSLNFIKKFVAHNISCTHNNSSVNVNTSEIRGVPHIHKRSRRSVSNVTETLVHGDILIRRKSSGVRHNKTRTIQHSAVADDAKLWPDGVIPYGMVSSLGKHRCLLESAMLQIMLNSCVRFKRRTHEDRFYMNVFQNDTGCYSSIGFNDNYRKAALVSLPEGCLNIGTVVHELLHAVGFYHHQNRHDRADYLDIYWKNIRPDFVDNFNLLNPTVGKLVTSFDYDSVMLYGNRSFSNDGHNITMKAKMKGVKLLEVFDKPGLSFLDAVAISKLYKCTPNSRQMRHFYENPYVLESLGELVKSCPTNSSLLLYTFLRNN